MKLHYAKPSPYVRKVRVVAREVGIAERIEEAETAVSPVDANDAVAADNPIGKVPTLVTDDGVALYDSRVISEYLDSLHDGARLFPAEGPTRWAAIRRQALGDGILDSAVANRYETVLRPEALRWDDWVRGQQLKISRSLDALEAEADDFGDAVDIGTITVACALGYLDFRFAVYAWRAAHPQLAAWFEGFAGRPSMQQTAPDL